MSSLNILPEPDPDAYPSDHDFEHAFEIWLQTEQLLRGIVLALRRGMTIEEVVSVLGPENLAAAVAAAEAEKVEAAERAKAMEGLTWGEQRRKLADMAKPGYPEREAARQAKAAVKAEREAKAMALTCIWCGKRCRTDKSLERHELECQGDE